MDEQNSILVHFTSHPIFRTNFLDKTLKIKVRNQDICIKRLTSPSRMNRLE
jgi:hypothetical protein